MERVFDDRTIGGAKHLPWLDAIRFMAAFMVLLSHTRNDFLFRMTICLQINKAS